MAVMTTNSSRRRVGTALYLQVLAAILIGALLGHFAPHFAEAMKPLGDGFIRLIKMIVAPVVFCTIVTGIAGMEDMKKVGRTAGLALLYFEAVTGLALLLGLAIANGLQPGAGMNVDPASLDPAAVRQYAPGGSSVGAVDFLLNIIPTSVVEAFAGNEILQVLFFAVLFGIALHRLGEQVRGVIRAIDKVSQVLFKLIAMIMRIAPLGAFGAMAFTVGKYGVDSLLSLGGLLICFYATCLVFIFGILGVIARIHGFGIWPFLKYIREEIVIVIGTSSSEAALPRMLEKLEALGIRKSVVGLVVPTGYSFNQDGTSIYLTMAAVFLAQATNTPFDLTQQLSLLGVLLFTSKGVAGVTGTGFIVLAASVSATGFVPVGALSLILGIDRFMSEARSVTNLIGNGVAALVVGKWCGAVDDARVREVLTASTRMQR